MPLNKPLAGFIGYRIGSRHAFEHGSAIGSLRENVANGTLATYILSRAHAQDWPAAIEALEDRVDDGIISYSNLEVIGHSEFDEYGVAEQPERWIGRIVAYRASHPRQHRVPELQETIANVVSRYSGPAQ